LASKRNSLRKSESANEEVETIYFGEEHLSVLTSAEIDFLISECINYSVVENPEITLEAILMTFLERIVAL
jgi:oxygen-independent coproporphyrinogen-3 oxidase